MRKRINLEQEIPEEIIEEILFHLPVKSLLRFKCVSKRWRSFISSEYFIKRHLSKSRADEKDNGSKFIFSFEGKQNNSSTRFLSVGSSFSLDDDEPIVTTSLDIQIRPETEIQVVESCNGLVLVENIYTGHLICWNPSTRKTKHIEKPFGFGSGKVGGYGFGYNESTDEYKVVCFRTDEYKVVCFRYMESFEPRTHAHMYSSKTDSWKGIEDLDKHVSGGAGKFVNGRLHWLVFGYAGWEIVALDLVEEKYETVDWPVSFPEIDLFPPYLENTGGCLTLMDFNRYTDAMSVWVMTEYGARESWTKIWTFPNSFDPPIEHECGSPTPPLCLKRNGDVVVAFRSEIVAYNGENLLRWSQVDKFDRLIGSISYVESLVSPFGSDDDETASWMMTI
ncbi:PREDICTED: F-box/kelch-repeat protein At3g23880-like [Erythranthe guttata]|nr:PREDICTED: F-box/kelch-repeat protein At3g23880-like [Erythranthe guttata]|eukprot:XP_012838094.1 PREDICTED: F-box/kelch-repeat protein At3g23880-like [Erythranthe guttata]